MLSCPMCGKDAFSRKERDGVLTYRNVSTAVKTYFDECLSCEHEITMEDEAYRFLNASRELKEFVDRALKKKVED